MSLKRVSKLLVGALVIGLSTTSTSFAKNDKIILVDGRSMSGLDITEDKFAAIKYRKGRTAATVEGKKTLRIVYGNQPRSFASAEGKRKGGQYLKAASEYLKAAEAGKGGKWVKPYSYFYAGECYRLAGDGEKAVSNYKKSLNAAKKEHFLYPQIMIGMGQAHALNESWSEAESSLKKISDGSFGVWRPRADYALGKVLMANKKMNDARRAFSRVQSQRDDASMQMAGTVGEGQTYLAEKNFNKAISFFERILKRRNLPRSVVAGAWAGIGECEVAKGGKDSDKRALLAFLKVVTQFAGTPEAYPKALAGAAKLYDKFGRKSQAKALRRELKSRCPLSPEAKALSDKK